MEEFNQLLEKLNFLNLTQNSRDWIEDLPEDIYKDYFIGKNPIDSNLNVDTHRWYELSTSVYKFNNKYLGVRSITNMFSEMSEPSDIGHQIEFIEMIPITTITYKQK